jgi:hypothetical protein
LLHNAFQFCLLASDAPGKVTKILSVQATFFNDRKGPVRAEIRQPGAVRTKLGAGDGSDRKVDGACQIEKAMEK